LVTHLARARASYPSCVTTYPRGSSSRVFVIRASSFVCSLLLCPSCRKQPPARSRSMSFAASPRFRSS